VNDGDDLVPPASSRQPRSMKDELPLDDGLPGILDPEADHAPASEERPPASRKVASVRGAEVDTAHDVHDFSTWEIDGITAEPPPTRNSGWLSGERKGAVEDVRVRIERHATTPAPGAAEAVRRMLPEGDVVLLASPPRAFRAETFGDLLDAALALGKNL
jgi:hypothetical protein